MDLNQLYINRFASIPSSKRNLVWLEICRYLNAKIIEKESRIFDLGCGFGEFINNIECREKWAFDLNPEAGAGLNSGIQFVACASDNLAGVQDGYFDYGFASNFFEHLESKETLFATLREVKRILRPNGKFIIIGPNIRYAKGAYWDFIDHNLPLSEKSLSEALTLVGLRVETCVDRFLPFTMKSRLPTNRYLVRAYLNFSPVWRILGAQFLIVSVK